jgi:hypothetical protein
MSYGLLELKKFPMKSIVERTPFARKPGIPYVLLIGDAWL